MKTEIYNGRPSTLDWRAENGALHLIGYYMHHALCGALVTDHPTGLLKLIQTRSRVTAEELALPRCARCEELLAVLRLGGTF